MPEVAQIFRRYGTDYRARFGDRMLPSHRRAMEDIVRCRTEALGGHLVQCNHCGRQEYVYHSCRNRSCPKCYRVRTEAWLHKRREQLLPVRYYHLVFTLPQPLRDLVRRNQSALYAVLFRAAVESLKALARDRRYLGGMIGILAVLHTWTRALVYHPHVHCLVPGGALADNGQWRSAKHRFLVPVRALSVLFRAKFMALARKALPNERFPASIWKTPWVVYSKASVQGPERVLEYLARYVHRVAIANHRIVSASDGEVTFRYWDSRDRRAKTMTLSAQEFIRRFLQHVLPRGFHKVRAFGLLSPSNRDRLETLQQVLLDTDDRHEEKSALPANGLAELGTPADQSTCPGCGIGILVIVAFIPRPPRSPP